MSKIAVSGNIPEKITYYSSKSIDVSVGCEWDLNSFNFPEKPKDVKIAVTPAYPVDSKDSNAAASAINWCKQPVYDVDTQNYIKNEDYNKFEIDNTPFSGVKITSLEHRGQGGRAYKAIIHGFYVDLREDVVLDAILKVGVDPGGILKGEYVWAKIGSQLKIIRIGSEIHRMILDYQTKKVLKPVSKKLLEIGGVYQNIKKVRVIFLGYVNTTNLLYDFDSNQRDKFVYKFQDLKKEMLFYKMSLNSKLDDFNLEKIMNKNFNNYDFMITKNHSFIEKIGNVFIDNDIVDKIRKYATARIENDIFEYIGVRPPPNRFRKINQPHLYNEISHFSPYINIYKYGETQPDVFNVQKYLLFS